MKREAITEQELEAVRKAIGKEPYADYVYAQCCLGFLPGKFLSLKKDSVYTENGQLFLTGVSGTGAGTDRLVPVPDAVRDIIKVRLRQRGTEYLFPRMHIVLHGFAGWRPMTRDYYNRHVFRPLMRKLGIAEGKTPRCAGMLRKTGGGSSDQSSIRTDDTE